MAVELSEAFFAKIAGWEAMKRARAFLEMDQVLSSNWTPPILKGVVQEGSSSYRAGWAIRSETNLDNLCTCRQARESGMICAHSVAAGLHHLRRTAVSIADGPRKDGMAVVQKSSSRPKVSRSRLQ